MHPIVGDTRNPTLPNLKEIIDKHLQILNNNLDFRETFKTPPIIAFKKCFFGTNNWYKY